MARHLLDTDAIIDFLLGIPRSVALIRGLDDQGDELCICDVAISEVFAGLRSADRDHAHRLLATWEFLPTDAGIARRAGEWRYDYARRGLSLSTSDVLIAATAQAHDATIVTGNTSDYPMPDLRVLPLPRSTR